MPVQIKELDYSEINEAVSLHNLNYGDKRTKKQWIWEYKSNYPDLFVFTIIKDDDRVVGTQGMIPIYLNIGGKTYLSGKSENSLLDSKYRGRGLFTELYDFALSLCKAKEMCCVWGFTGITSAIKALNRVGFSIYKNVMHNYVLSLNPRQFISSEILGSTQSIVRKAAKSLVVVILYICSCARRLNHRQLKRARRIREFSIEQKLRSPSDLGRLYERLREKHADLIHIEQDEKHINWRIFNNPNVKFTTYFVYEVTLLRAYCYISINNKKKAYLSDLTFEDYETGDFLLKTILNLFYEKKISIVSFIGNVKNPLIADVFNLLKNHGFIKTGEFAAFVLRNISYENRRFLHDIENWYLNGLWTEGYEF